MRKRLQQDNCQLSKLYVLFVTETKTNVPKNFYTISVFVFVCIFVDSGRAWWYFGGELMAKAKGRG